MLEESALQFNVTESDWSPYKVLRYKNCAVGAGRVGARVQSRQRWFESHVTEPYRAPDGGTQVIDLCKYVLEKLVSAAF
mgnify:CR=1 FL=1